MPNKQYVVYVQHEKNDSTPTYLLINTRFIPIFYKVNPFDCLIKMNVLALRRLFSLINGFLQLVSLVQCNRRENPSNCAIQMSSLWFPSRKVVLISICHISQPLYITIVNKILMNLSITTGEKVSSYSTLYFFEQFWNQFGFVCFNIAICSNLSLEDPFCTQWELFPMVHPQKSIHCWSTWSPSYISWQFAIAHYQHF